MDFFLCTSQGGVTLRDSMLFIVWPARPYFPFGGREVRHDDKSGVASQAMPSTNPLWDGGYLTCH